MVLNRLRGVKIHRTTRHHGRNGVLVHHLSDRVSKQNDILIKGLNVPLQFDAIDEVDRDRDMFLAKKVEERVLKKLAF